MTDPRRRPWHRDGGRLVALAALMLLLGCGGASQPTDDRDEADSTGAAADTVYPEQTFYDYRLIESTHGIRQWVLDSDIMYKYKGRDDVDLVRVAMDFFRDGEYYSTLLADSGTAHTRTRDVHVWGHVEVTTHDGRRLRTSELFYTAEDGLIRNDVYNVFDRGADIVTGVGLEATPDLDRVEIKRQVKGVIGDDTADPAEDVERGR